MAYNSILLEFESFKKFKYGLISDFHNFRDGFDNLLTQNRFALDYYT